MSEVALQGSEAAMVAFAGELTVRHIGDMHARLLAAVQGHNAIVIDASAATEVDLSFIQLVLSARRSAADLGKTISLSAPASGALAATLVRAGLVAGNGSSAAAAQQFWSN